MDYSAIYDLNLFIIELDNKTLYNQLLKIGIHRMEYCNILYPHDIVNSAIQWLRNKHSINNRDQLSMFTAQELLEIELESL